MTLRSLALRTLLLTALAGVFLVAASASKFRFYEELLQEGTRFLTKAAKVAPVVVTEDNLKKQSPPPGRIAKLLVISKSGERRRIHYFKNGNLKITEHLGEGEKVVRRDFYQKKHIRVQQLFDPEKNLLQTNFIDERGRLIHRKAPPVAPPFPGGQYG